MKKSVILSLVLALFLTLTGCQKKSGEDPEAQKKFDEFVNAEFVDYISSNYLNMHYSVIDPEKYGVNRDEVEVSFGDDFTDEAIQEALDDFEETKKEFKTFNRSALTADQQLTYDIINYQIALAEEGVNEKFDYISNAFSPMQGMQSQFPTIFSDFIFYTERDIQDMITLMNDVPRYLADTLGYTQKQKENGYMMSNATIDSVVEYCNKILESGENSSILDSLNKSINEFEGIDESTKNNYIAQTKEAFINSFLPAYQNIVDTLTTFKSDDNNSMGLANVENGKEYYEYLFKAKTASNKSVADAEKALKSLAQKSITSAQKTAQRSPSAYDDYYEGTTKTQYTDFDTMLKDLNTWNKNNFPTINDVPYNIQALPEETANNGVAAYYMNSPIDNTHPDVIRVNMTSGNVDDISTFKTIAHEGIPGHMYQMNYIKQNLNNNYLSTCVNMLGYTEGYATYVEFEALDSLDINNNLRELYRDLEVYQNTLIALMDIGIHYHGWDKAETEKFLSDNGLSVTSVDAIYDQIQGDPGAFLSYYVGYMEIRELKDKAEKDLGSKFTEIGFNTALLESGTAPFSIVQENIEQYIKDNK